ncbi:hypothetical protein, partial [Mediterraneibacter gnavus]|uniref:hypothetical protein n=1 Tax=Mediterraneibacter gnavus TaxID=33038 RepID=UPI003D2A5219
LAIIIPENGAKVSKIKCFQFAQQTLFMGFLSGLFHSRDKPTNSTNGSAYCFLFGGSNSGKAVNERSAMQ